MCEFSRNDVLTVARAVVENPLRYMDGDYTPYIFCVHCDSKLKGYGEKEEDFKHEVNCPVLVALDILTGS